MPVQEAGTGLSVAELLTEARPPTTIDGVVVGTVVAFSEDGSPLVTFLSNPAGRPIASRSTLAIDATDVGREVALTFDRGDPGQPIILGKMWHPNPTPDTGEATEVRDERLILSADKQLELRCGKSSLVMTREGKIIIRGEYLLSRSAGVNRIKGGSVQIN